jgi:hypothetical protein
MMPACRPNFAEAACTTWMDEQVFYVRDKSGIWIGYGGQTDVRRAKHFWLGMGMETKEQMYSNYKFFLWRTLCCVTELKDNNALRTGSFKLFKRPFPGFFKTILTL